MIDNQICYTGGIYDEETALYYLNARYYDLEIGRFISQDTYRGEMNDPGQWHLYAYCANNPINYTDPSGHTRIPTWLTSLVIDGVLSVYAWWWKWSYDLIGKSIIWAFKQYGSKTASNKLLSTVPKVKGAYGNFYTKIRKAIWRATGYTLKIGSPTAGAISLALDYYSDKRLNGWIRI